MTEKLKVLMAGVELAPLAKVGGLADVLGSLPVALAKLGVEVRVIIPFHGSINARKYKIKLFKKDLGLKIGERLNRFDLYVTKLSGTKIKVYLLKHRFFSGPRIYVGNKKHRPGVSYARGLSDIERFVFFSKAVVEVIRELKWRPDIVHCHDWHTALIPTFLDEYSLASRNFPNLKTLLTIHNLASQGKSRLDIVDYASLHHRLTPALMEDYYDRDGQIVDLMKIGILSADFINTVSPTYAREILTREHGEGLEKYLERRKNDLAGILNGLDTKLFNPSTDRLIKKRYNSQNVFIHKASNKDYLQQKLSLLRKTDLPLIGLVTRLVRQKGLDILIPALERILQKHSFQLVVLGDGQPEYETAFKNLARKYPRQVKVVIKFDLKLAQQIYAGADFFLMPSLFEPCGLGQMIAMRYGTIPLVRQTGGLADTVKNNKTGLVFKSYFIKDMVQIIEKALRLYKNKAKMKKIVRADMLQDFSWVRSAKLYLNLYKRLK